MKKNGNKGRPTAETFKRKARYCAHRLLRWIAGLFSPAWKGGDEQRALAWIEKCTDQKKLTKIAREAPSVGRRVAAIQKITDMDMLARAVIAKDFYDDRPLGDLGRAWYRSEWTPYCNEDCQRAALERIDDPETLAKLLESDITGHLLHNAGVRMVVRKLRDLGYDLRTAAADTRLPADSRCEAVDLINDQPFLIGLARGEQQKLVRSRAIRAITVPEVRREYCESDGTHEWESVDHTVSEIGDTRYISDTYRCRYCGKERHEQDGYKF